MSILKCTFIKTSIHFPGLYPQPNRELRRIKRVGKVTIIKQQVNSMCMSEALLEKCKNCRRETICSKMLIFESKML
jgi:hypothetical protein